jgi:CRISPR system Cascade subunit CasA
VSASYDLLTEPWIPATRADGSRVDLSLIGTLGRAHELAELVDQSPLVTVALHRMLLAVLHRAYGGPRDIRAWRAIWAAGRFDEAVLGRYLTSVADRWDLFHPVYPWYQTGNMPAGYKARPVRALDVLSSAYGAVAKLYDGTPDSRSGATPARAARWLLAQQTFALPGTTGHVAGESPAASAAPLTKAAAAIVMGASLFRTLCLNLGPYQHREDDRPAWERGGAANGERLPDGLVDLLTWQARRLCLLRPEDPGEVRHVQIAAGWGFPKEGAGKDRVSWQPVDLEPMVAWRTTVKGGLVPFSVSGERTLWRDSTALLVDGEDQMPPASLSWARDLATAGLVSDADVTGLDVTGLATAPPPEQYKIVACRSERIPVSLSGPSRASDAAALAERAWQALRGAILWAKATRLAAVPPDQLATARSLAVAPAGAAFWGALEPDFRWWAGGEDDLAEWSRVVTAATWRAFEGVADDNPTSPAFGHWFRARRILGGSLRKALEGER